MSSSSPSGSPLQQLHNVHHSRHEPANAPPPDMHAAAARVFDHLTNAILGSGRKTGRGRGGQMLVLNRRADGTDDANTSGYSTTNVHMGSDGRVLKVVALGRPDTPRAPAPASRMNFAEDSVRAAVAKQRLHEGHGTEAETSPARRHDEA